jgi:hypothetical protein
MYEKVEGVYGMIQHTAQNVYTTDIFPGLQRCMRCGSGVIQFAGLV